MHLSHKIEILPNKKQKEHLDKCIGTARFTYNWALIEWKKQYELGKKPSGFSLKKEFNKIKYEEFPWLKEIPRDCHSQPFTNLQKAFNNFFKKKKGYPKFHKKGIHDSFYVSSDKLKIKDKKFRVPVVGWVKLTEELRFSGKINSAAISKKAGKYFVSISVDVGETYKKERISNNKIGIDLGIKDFIITSDGEKLTKINYTKKYEKKLKREQQKLSKKVKGSNNRKKQILKVQKVHYKISNSRKDILHKISTKLVRENQSINLENLNISGMLKNRKLSKSISDASWGELVRQLEYKSEIYGNEINKVNRFFASSKLCSVCGYKYQELKLSERQWKCPDCGTQHDRDINAAKNIRDFEKIKVPKAIGKLGLKDRKLVENFSSTDYANSQQEEPEKQELNHVEDRTKILTHSSTY